MPWTVPYTQLDPDQLDFVDSTDNTKSVFISGFAGTGKSVLLVNKLQVIYDLNDNAKCCIVSFTHSLLEAFRLGLEECGLEDRIADKSGSNVCKALAGQIDLVTKYELKKNQNGNNAIYYDFVFVDEVQDVCVSDLKIINSSRIKSTIVAGDHNQSIYSEDPQKNIHTGQKEPTIGPGDIKNVLVSEERRLTYGHRLTPSILACVFNLIPEIKKKLLNEFEVAHNRDTDVMICHADDEDAEAEYVYTQALDNAEDVELTAILLPMHGWIRTFCKYILKKENVPWNDDVENMFKKRDYSSINAYFQKHNIKIEYVGSNHGSFIHARKHNNILLMTYHSSKGMDFQNVFLPFLSASRYSNSLEYFIPRPLMVAMTRSNYNLTISFSGEPLESVGKFKDLDATFYNSIEDSDDNSDDAFILPF